MDLSKAVEGVVADEDEEVVEEAPGESGPRSIGVFKGLTARELNGERKDLVKYCYNERTLLRVVENSIDAGTDTQKKGNKDVCLNAGMAAGKS